MAAEHSIQPTMRLPPELWALVVGFLPTVDKRTCLFVSKQHHDSALSLLFSHITVHFGNILQSFTDSGGLIEEFYRAEVIPRQHVTWEILRHISTTPTFARIVKSVTVQAIGCDPEVFGSRLLAETLCALVNLRSFYWYSSSRCAPDPHILDALARHPNLELVLPLSTTHCSSLATFRNIRSLTLLDKHQPWVYSDYLPGTVLHLETALRNSASVITRLSTGGSLFLQLPVSTFFNISALELVYPPKLSGVTFVLRHCESLRSLAFVLDPTVIDQLPDVLRMHSSAVPSLTSFKLLFNNPWQSQHSFVDALSVFLQTKTKLRALDLPSAQYSRDGPDLAEPVFGLFPQLPDVEILGIQIWGGYWSEDGMKRLDELLPINLTALSITIRELPRQGPIQAIESVHAFLDLIRKRTSLRYLHIRHDDDGEYFRQRLLEDHPESLELVGYGPYIRWLTRDPEAAARGMLQYGYSRCWSISKVMFRTAHDFGNVDWEWLLRYHELDEQYVFDDGMSEHTLPIY